MGSPPATTDRQMARSGSCGEIIGMEGFAGKLASRWWIHVARVEVRESNLQNHFATAAQSLGQSSSNGLLLIADMISLSPADYS